MSKIVCWVKRNIESLMTLFFKLEAGEYHVGCSSSLRALAIGPGSLFLSISISLLTIVLSFHIVPEVRSVQYEIEKVPRMTASQQLIIVV